MNPFVRRFRLRIDLFSFLPYRQPVLLRNRRIEALGEISSDFGRHLSQNKGPRIRFRLSPALHFGNVRHPWVLPTLNREGNNIIISGFSLFFCFLKNMTFGHCFSTCVARLATG